MPDTLLTFVGALLTVVSVYGLYPRAEPEPNLAQFGKGDGGGSLGENAPAVAAAPASRKTAVFQCSQAIMTGFNRSN